MHRTVRRMGLEIRIVLCALIVLSATSASAAIDVLVDSDGSDPTDFPDLVITHGNVLFDVPMAKVFGLDKDNGFLPLPSIDRFPNDLFDTLAKDEFLAAPMDEKEAVGILFSHRLFNNPGPNGDGQDIARMLFKLPLRAGGLPLGGPGPRRIQFKLGKKAGGGGGGAAKKGRKAGYIAPAKAPWGMAHWAAFIKGNKQKPGETEAELRKRIKEEIAAKKRRASKRSLAAYSKLVDDSKYMDPIENYVVELVNDDGRDEIEVELVFIAEKASFSHLAELLDGVLIQITNDPSLAPTDPNMQPVDEELGDAGTVDVGADETISMALGDPEVPMSSILDSVSDGTLLHNQVRVTFSGPILEGDGATQYLAIGRPSGLPDLIAYEQIVGDVGADIAADLADQVNATPFRGDFPYSASALGNEVVIDKLIGGSVDGASILRTNESLALSELVETQAGGGAPVDLPALSRYPLVALGVALALTAMWRIRRRPAAA